MIAMAAVAIITGDFPKILLLAIIYYLERNTLFPHEETEVQQGKGTCPRPCVEAVLRFKTRLLASSLIYLLP